MIKDSVKVIKIDRTKDFNKRTKLIQLKNSMKQNKIYNKKDS